MLDPIVALGWPTLLAMAFGGVLIGFSKTSFGGLGAVSVALFALGMPARESTAAVLLLLLTGDAVALRHYGRDVQWRTLLHLLPAVVPGLALGAVFINLVDDTAMRRTIGFILLAMVGLRLVQRRPRPAPGPATAPGGPPLGPGPATVPGVPDATRGGPAPRPGAAATRPAHPLVAVGTGIAAGFTTMTANAAAPVMALFLLAHRFEKARYLGTNAWFFALVNLCKVPFTVALGLFTPAVLLVAALLVPAVLIGTVLGRGIVDRVSQRQFETATTAATAVACLGLLLR